MRHSLYWDDFETRLTETVDCLRCGGTQRVRRVAVFITEACNFRCKYCNVKQTPRTLSKERFEEVVETYGKDAIIHITGGEPSTVKWLYPYLEEYGPWYRFHLNTNAFIMPPAGVRRLKVSLDSCRQDYWDSLVGRVAFDRVVANIQAASKLTVTSITYTLTRENYRDAPEFVRFSNNTFPDLYALFFSVYKGTNPRFVFTSEDIDVFFQTIVPELEGLLSEESLALLHETLGEKQRLIAGNRFPQNDLYEPCYLSMTERVIAPDGNEYACSPLYRDGILTQIPAKHERCLYGCNQRLVDFNKCVSERLKP